MNKCIDIHKKIIKLKDKCCKLIADRYAIFLVLADMKNNRFETYDHLIILFLVRNSPLS